MMDQPRDWMTYDEALELAIRLAKRSKTVRYVIHNGGRRWIIRERVSWHYTDRGRHVMRVDQGGIATPYVYRT